MIVGPLVFCTLVVGISKLGDFKSVGRIGIKTIGYFYFATILSLVGGFDFRRPWGVFRQGCRACLRPTRWLSRSIDGARRRVDHSKWRAFAHPNRD